MGGYLRAIDTAKMGLGLDPDLPVVVAGAWHDVDDFLDSLAARVAAALSRLGPETPVLFTAHSLPRSVADGEPEYIQQLKDTAAAVAERAGIPTTQWTFAYQSAGHTREEWLTPDIKDLLPALSEAGHRVVLAAPIQFLADHLEVLYDIDVAAREEAATLGIELGRPAMLNCDPGLIRALAVVVQRSLFQGGRPLAIVN
jgi:ferrochelatase